MKTKKYIHHLRKMRTAAPQPSTQRAHHVGFIFRWEQGVKRTTFSSIIVAVFVPQILKIHRAGNAKGISVGSILLSMFVCIGISSYAFKRRFVFRWAHLTVYPRTSFPSQYGDALMVATQMAIVVMQSFYYSGQSSKIFMLLSVLGSIATAMYLDVIPLQILAGVQAITIPMTIVAKVFRCHKLVHDLHHNTDDANVSQLHG
jgi:hypothetical protein